MIVKLSQGQGNFFHDDVEQKKIIYFIMFAYLRNRYMVGSNL